MLNRIADLEAYINNTAPKALVNVAGPGHNAWMMICAALVLFMTLPGLALFYGGLVRRRTCCPSWRSASAARAWSPSCGGPFGYSFVFDAASRRSSAA